ncbi:MAG: tetratricopeptide repeat protein [bacterium]
MSRNEKDIQKPQKANSYQFMKRLLLFGVLILSISFLFFQGIKIGMHKGKREDSKAKEDMASTSSFSSEKKITIPMLLESIKTLYRGIKIETLKKKAASYADKKNYSKAIELQKKVLELARIEKDKQEEAVTCNNIAGDYLSAKDYNNAIKFYSMASELYHKMDDSKREAEMILSIANIYDYYLNDSEGAIGLYMKALTIFRKIDCLSEESYVLTMLSSLYSRRGEKEKAQSLHKEAQSILKKSAHRKIKEFETALAKVNKPKQKVNLLKDLASGYWTLGNKHKAIICYEEARRILKELGYGVEEAGILRLTAGIYESMENYEKALHLLNESLALSKKLDDSVGKTITLDHIARIEKKIRLKGKETEEGSYFHILQK